METATTYQIDRQVVLRAGEVRGEFMNYFSEYANLMSCNGVESSLFESFACKFFFISLRAGMSYAVCLGVSAQLPSC
eukprot:6381661-Amphidinium_carterae.1